MKIGDTVWIHVERYHKPEGFKDEDAFLPLVITSETRVSWVASEGWREFKFPKAKPPGEYHKDPETRLSKNKRGSVARIYLSRRAVDDECWLTRNRDPIRKHIETVLRAAGNGDAAELRRIASAVGYVEAA